MHGVRPQILSIGIIWAASREGKGRRMEGGTGEEGEGKEGGG